MLAHSAPEHQPPTPDQSTTNQALVDEHLPTNLATHILWKLSKPRPGPQSAPAGLTTRHAGKKTKKPSSCSIFNGNSRDNLTYVPNTRKVCQPSSLVSPSGDQTTVSKMSEPHDDPKDRQEDPQALSKERWLHNHDPPARSFIPNVPWPTSFLRLQVQPLLGDFWTLLNQPAEKKNPNHLTSKHKAKWLRNKISSSA